MTDTIDLTAAADQIGTLTNTVTEEHLDRPTPCDDWAVRDLLGHLVGLTRAFTGAAQKATDSGPFDGEPRDLIDAEGAWKQRLATQLDDLVSAWQQPEAWQGEAAAGGVTMPASEMGVVALDELVLHGWDLAVATAQDFDVDPGHLEAVSGFVTAMSAPDQADQRNGLFGPPQSEPDGASTLDGVLALSGRNPDWSATS